jgi:GNAT superfamily N-acetyltransferase
MSTISLTIDQITIPQSIDGPEGQDFLDLVRVRNEVEVGVLGSDALLLGPEALAPMFRDASHRLQRHFVARLDGSAVGRARLAWKTVTEARSASLTIDVLESFRRQGIGQALLDRLESEAAGLGRDVLQSDLGHQVLPGGERLPSPTGFGSLPMEDPGVRFLVRNAYVLEMVARISSLEVDAVLARAVEHQRSAQAAAGPDHRVMSWVGHTPDHWLDDIAVLKTRMDTDAPSAGLEVVEDVWDAARVRAHDQVESDGGRERLTSAVEHVPSGRLAGFTEITFPADGGPYAIQEDTLVLREHRGHRLGMLLKAANLTRFAELRPGTVITTFNAQDNRPMLDVNEALGFEAIGLEGNWQKRV